MKIKKKFDLNFKKCLFIIHNDADGRGCEILSNIYMDTSNINFKIIQADKGDENLQSAINNGFYDAILMCDCSFKSEKSLSMINKFINDGNQFFLIDHHRNAMDYEFYDWSFVSMNEGTFNNSGTELLYQFLNQQIGFNENKTLSELVELIRSYDTWDWFKTNNQKAVDLISLFSFDHTLFISDMINNINNNLPIFDEKQKILLKIINTTDKTYINKVVEYIEFLNYKDKEVAILVGGQMQGLIANEVFKKYPNIDFIVFIVSATKLSFRSRDDKENVYEIANRLGGGGHRNAAGCNINVELIETIKNYIF